MTKDKKPVEEDRTCPPGMMPIEDALLEDALRLPADESSRATTLKAGLSEEAINWLYGESPACQGESK